MEQEQKGIYLGIDINERYTMISYYQLHMSEPQTLSTVMGSESYQIPTCLGKKRGMGQWFFGNEAKIRAKNNEAEEVEDLLQKALDGEEIFVDHEKYAARDLLAIFLKNILSLSGIAYTRWPIAKLVITVDKVSVEYMELFSAMLTKLGLDTDKLMMVDYREAFYYYVLNQKPEVFLHDVAMFDYRESDVISCILQRNLNTTPQVVNLTYGNHGKLFDNKDEQFTEILKKEFEGRVVSSVFLIGDGFDGDWTKQSLQFMCQGRKVFVGKNLYSKGACYAGIVKDKKIDWPFVYIGANELKLNLYLKVLVQNEMRLFTLLTAGESWFESKGECEVILDGSPELELFVQEPESREAHVEVLELTDLPERDRRTTRLRITAVPTSDRDISITIRDLGFGEIAPGTNKSWEHSITLEEDNTWEN